MMVHNNIFKGDFFEKGGITRNAGFIIFIVLLMIFQIGLSFKNEEMFVKNRKIDKEIFDLGMRSMSLKIELMNFYKRSVIENNVYSLGLETSDKLPFVIEDN